MVSLVAVDCLSGRNLVFVSREESQAVTAFSGTKLWGFVHLFGSFVLQLVCLYVQIDSDAKAWVFLKLYINALFIPELKACG